MPTSLGKNQDEQPSGTIPRAANTKPILAFFTASLKSAARVIVMPIPTAAPLKATITGFKHA